jgi:hypothetical protein
MDRDLDPRRSGQSAQGRVKEDRTGASGKWSVGST